MGTVNVLEAARGSDVSVLLNVTSDKCYHNREIVWGYREEDRLGGFDPYSSSKACAELVTSAYQQSFGNGSCPKCATARAGNVIGGGDWALDRLVPDCIRALTHKEIINIRRPHAVRPWQHVLEPLSGYLAYIEDLASGVNIPLSLNFGPSDAGIRPVAEVVERITQLWGDGASWRIETSDSLHEAGLLTLDSTLARHHLGWRSRWSFEEAVDYTVEWYRSFYSGSKMDAISLDQIGIYEGALAGAAA